MPKFKYIKIKRLHKLIILFDIIILCLISGCNKRSDSSEFCGNLNKDLNKLVPIGQVKVNNIVIDIPYEKRERYDEIVDKIINGYETNCDYFQDKNDGYINYDEYINKLKIGATIIQHPWNYHFGLTDDEYNELYTSLDFCKTTEGTINIEKSDKNVFTITVIENIKNLDTISIDLSDKTVTTKYGIYEYDSYRKASDKEPNIIANRWCSYEWYIDDDKSLSYNDYYYQSFHIGQLLNTNEIIIFLRNYDKEQSIYNDIIFSFNPGENK